jgi:uridylate kinase
MQIGNDGGDNMADVKVLSVGGSILAPSDPDVQFIRNFVAAIREYLNEDADRTLILVSGGGAPARIYQQAYREIIAPESGSEEEQDWIGIAATRLNAHLLRGALGDLCINDVVTDPTAPFSFTGRVLVAAGWKPGFSTDNDAVVLAERFGADTVVNLSNIAKIYSADPKLDPSAVPLDTISWNDFRKMVGDTWTPGKNLPFDPVAAKRGEKLGLRVITAEGRNIENMKKILSGEAFEGSVIEP